MDGQSSYIRYIIREQDMQIDMVMHNLPVHLLELCNLQFQGIYFRLPIMLIVILKLLIMLYILLHCKNNQLKFFSFFNHKISNSIF